LTSTTYPTDSWFDPRIDLRASPLHGKGMFATALIWAGETLMIWGGVVYTREELSTRRVKLNPVAHAERRIDDDLYIAAPMTGMDHYFNHSCDPTTWMQDTITVIARRDIQPAEELTIDYATLDLDGRHRIKPCRCGTLLCRGQVTGSDWRLPELQQRYRGHFMPFIERCMAE